VIRFGNLLHHATAAIEPPVAILAARQHRWAVGERYAFDEEPGLELPAQVADIDRHLAGWCTPDPDRRQVVHVDLAGNVFLGPDGTPVVLDISPGCRSPGYADAVVVADALLWSGAGPELLEALGDRVRAHARVARGLRFRLATEQVAAMRGQRSVHDADPAPYRRVIEALS
jgi:hypothetical protein